MKWFGPAPFSHACVSTPHVPTPTGTTCPWCEEGFAREDCGYIIPHFDNEVRWLAYHAECWLRQIMGSVAHIEHACTCYGGTADDGDPPQMTRREAAQAAVVAFFAHCTDEGL